MLSTLAFLPFIASALMAQDAQAETPSTQSVEQSVSFEELYKGYTTEKEFIIKKKDEILLDVPFVHQINNLIGTPDAWAGGSACGPTAITMALKFNNENVTLYEVMNKLPGSVYVKGVMFYNLKEGPKEFGYTSHEIEISSEAIFETLSNGNPVLMNVQNYDYITGHEIVVVGIKGYNAETKIAKSLIVHDPFRAPFREFEYINEYALRQPEGAVLPIGIIKPFYITK